MKRRRMQIGFGLAIAIALATGCSIPDYQLTFSTQLVSSTSTSATVSYTLTNTGSKDVYNATIDIGVRNAAPISSPVGHTSTPSTTVSVGSTVTGSVIVAYPFTTANGNYESYVLSAGWDSSKSMSVY
jgi:hypothetical protein